MGTGTMKCLQHRIDLKQQYPRAPDSSSFKTITYLAEEIRAFLRGLYLLR